MRPVSSWGRLSADPHEVIDLADRESAAAEIRRHQPGIAHGLGKSYGDEALNPGGVLWHTARLDRFIAFDAATGRLTCEAGVVLRDIQRTLVPRGWSLPVVPGTQLVTVGGAIANDVHGKNHHVMGTFGEHVLRLRIARTDGEIIECGPKLRPEWLAATVGGLGLTGVILEAEIQLRPVNGPWVDSEIVPFAGLDAFFRLSESSEADWEHTVSWIDCTSGANLRGLFMRARPTDKTGPDWIEKRKRMPLIPPLSLVNRLSLRPFNAAYFALNSRKTGVRTIHGEPFLFPLDSLHDWNRMYGPKGFFQYQSVVPRDAAPAATRDMLNAIAASGEGSFLAVLKVFGDRRAAGLLSFPRPGVTLALDFRNTPAVFPLFERLDAIVRAAGGRLYPAKDARMPRAMFEATYPTVGAFRPFRDPRISSAMSRRLMGS